MKRENNIPSYLKKRGKVFYKAVISEFFIETVHDRERLGQASSELDVQDAAMKAIDEHGFYVLNRYNKLIENPALKTLQNSRTLFVRILRELRLDSSEPEEPRPPGLHE